MNDPKFTAAIANFESAVRRHERGVTIENSLALNAAINTLVAHGPEYPVSSLKQAAPDLLKVAELVVDWLDEEPGAHKLCDAARAAIAKAKGG